MVRFLILLFIHSNFLNIETNAKIIIYKNTFRLKARLEIIKFHSRQHECIIGIFFPLNVKEFIHTFDFSFAHTFIYIVVLQFFNYFFFVILIENQYLSFDFPSIKLFISKIIIISLRIFFSSSLSLSLSLSLSFSLSLSLCRKISAPRKFAELTLNRLYLNIPRGSDSFILR